MTLTGAQTNLYCDDPEVLAAFHTSLGMTENSRCPAHGAPDIVEVSIGGFTLGLVSRKAMEELAGMPSPKGDPQSEVVPWCDDARFTHSAAMAGGAKQVSTVELYDDRIMGGWVEDPEGNRVKFVAHVAGART